MAYLLTGQRCGRVRFDQTGTITEESMSLSSQVTSHPVEGGGEVNDHVADSPKTLSLSGVLLGGAQAAATLEQMQQQGDILCYEGSVRMDNIVITSLSLSTSPGNRNGYSFSASFQGIRLVSSQYVLPGRERSMSSQDQGRSQLTQYSTKTRKEGLRTVATEMLSSAAYQRMADIWQSKQQGGLRQRSNPGYNGINE